MADVESLLKETPAEPPCGPDLSYDAGFLELERAAVATPERQVGQTVVPGAPPEWRDVATRSEALLGRSKDVRVVIHWMIARLKLAGLPGLRDGLAVLRGLMEKYWGQFYPRLDAEDGNDPTELLSALALLSPAAEGFGDATQLRRMIREAPLIESKRLGKFSLRDAAGQAPADPAAPKPDGAMVEAAFNEATTEELQATLTVATESLAHVKAITDVLKQHIGAARTPDFNDLVKCLTEIKSYVEPALARRGGQAAPGADGKPAAGGAGPARAPGEIRSTADVVSALEKICTYYSRNEPSSPIPLLLRRAQRLVSKSFIEIIRDLSPAAIPQVETISGKEGKEAKPAEPKT